MADENDGIVQEQPAETDASPQVEGGQRVRWTKRDQGRAAPQAASGEGRPRGLDGLPPTVAGALSEAQLAALENAVQERIAAEQARAEEAQQRLQRVQADFANYKRRSEQEREQQAKFAAQLLVTELLPILDNFDRALAIMPDEVRSLPWTEGLLLVDRQLRATLERQGLKPIEAVGMRFDPMLHEAIMHEESSDHADDEVIAELQRGYMLHDRVVRPTLVKVAKNVASGTKIQEER